MPGDQTGSINVTIEVIGLRFLYKTMGTRFARSKGKFTHINAHYKCPGLERIEYRDNSKNFV
jgi:hypothetical protein